MKLYKARIPTIANDIITQLRKDGDIEVTNGEEAEKDIQSVLAEYLRLDRLIVEKTKDQLEQRGLSHGMFGRVRRSIAEKMDFGLGEEGITWICNQVLETFMQSSFIEEIFAADIEMRRKMAGILKRHMMVDDELDEEVRLRIKNLQEGSNHWDVEYAKVLEQIKRKRGLER
ncbi:MAG: DUF507 family protein [Deltaproteobacteria bacterium]|nr:DUF507 family protein [Deltaproteobacteria bacterium]